MSVLCLPGWPLEVSLPLIVTFVRTTFPTSLICSSLFIVFSCHHLPCLHLSINTLVVSVIVTESLLNVTLCFPGSLVSRVSGCCLCFLFWTDYLDFDLCLADNEIWITPINILLLDLPVCVRVVTEGLRHA